MASLSLPRVLQLKKNSLDAEREQFEKFQTLAIQKAINSIETPVKEKHVRSTIIGTFQEQSAITYWMVAIRLPLQDNRIVAWKFCHVTHKLLREGHPACLDDSQRHIGMIENLGKLWVHLREGYGRLVHLYCNLLVCKLKFHARNPRFPGNIQLTADELDNIAENDVNNYFQLCVELFDYMDDILNLQAAVFDSLGNARANSMTASGQCRLAALIPCAQDSSHIYDCNVRLLFRLHASLPADTLAGHRERFRVQFKKLSSFYKHASSLQYYRNLLTLPVLPSNPPNFLLQSDFGTYVAPVVSIPEPAPDEVDAIGSLIDTSDTISQATTPDHLETFDTRATPSPQPDPVVERDRLIDHLQNELKRMRAEVSQLVQERNTMLSSMREHCTRLETQLQTAKTEMEEERQKAEVLLAQTPEIQQKLTATEEKAKLTDEKFQKLKGAYTQLREEHITLIRQKAEVDKMATSLRAAATQHESAKTALQQQLNDRMKDVELLQQSASSSEEIEAYKSELSNLRIDLEQSRQKEVELETIRASMEALEIEHRTAATEQQEKITTLTTELKEVADSFQKIYQENEGKEIELSRVKEELAGLKEKSGDEYKKVVEEKEAALKEVSELTLQFNREKEEQVHCINNLQAELERLQQKLTVVEIDLETQTKSLQNKVKEIKDCESNQQIARVLIENAKNEEISQLKDQLKAIIDEKDAEINKLEKEIHEKAEFCDKQKSEEEWLLKTVSEHAATIEDKNKKVEELQSKLNEITSALEKQNLELEGQQKENEHKVMLLHNKLQTVTECKEEIIESLKALISEKDEQVISLNVAVNKLSIDVSRLEDELTEAQAELEIGKNELFTLKEEHESIMERNEKNVSLKNQELRSLHEEISKITSDKAELIAEKQKICSEFDLQKQVFQKAIRESEEAFKLKSIDIEILQNQKAEVISKLNEEIDDLKTKYEQLKVSKENETKTLIEKIQIVENELNNQLSEKDDVISQSKTNVEELKVQIEQIQLLNAKEKEESYDIVTKKEEELKMLESRLERTDRERLNAECELQDLLQHNTVLEADLAAAKRQLEEARLEMEKQNARLVTCAGEAALEVADGALAALERGNAQDTNRAAAELAAKALEELARHTEVKGNEESVARAVIFAAHNTASLSAYVSDVCNLSTDMELSDKLSNECRTMLSATKQCLEAVKSGAAPSPMCVEARAHVQGVARAAAAADRLNGGKRSVDDELADMDKAIEQAASQIEEMLAASRAGDSGVKLEVNGKILDACTTLMGAVKILVQDARKLQQELGDPKTRQKMYRRNPQWSEGLISAAKAVVFAAKLLVTSADEAVGAAGRVEGVSAAAHEVAGSTAQLVAASRARAPPSAPALARLTQASRAVAAATGAVVAAVRAGSHLVNEQEALDTSALTLTATRRLEMESKVRSLELECALDAERARLAALRKRHYHLAQMEENGNMTNGKQ